METNPPLARESCKTETRPAPTRTAATTTKRLSSARARAAP